jgi:serine/threonine protein kinase
MIGTILKNRYRIIQELGSGGFGETFIAEDLDIPSDPKPRCVVKRLQPAVIDPEVSRLFEQEAKILYNLGENHPQIPNLRAYFQEQNQFYLIQDLIIGQDLSQEIAQGKKLSESYVIKLLQDVLTVLDFVHQNNVIHRDIKPQNIIRRQDGKLILIDFGAVKQVKQKTIQAGTTSRTIGIGTAGYMPSEQAIGRPKFSSDVYALGIVAIQALTGVLPHQLPEDNNDEIVWKNLVNVSDNLATILTKMVRFRSGDRYANAGEVLEALNQAFSPQQKLQQNQVINQTQPKIKLQTSRANFTQLDQYLKYGQWEKADQETAKVMCKIMGREKEGWLTFDNCRDFPPEELRIIDQLWLQYSQDKFGFSVQKQIWLKLGGKLDGSYQWDTYKKLGEEVGWLKTTVTKKTWLGGGEKEKDEWLSYSELTFSTNAPKGHLPVGGSDLFENGQGGGVGFGWEVFMWVLEWERWMGYSFLYSKL